MNSAISQTYPNLEIIVSDDASVDRTLEIIAYYKDKTEIPIHIYHHQPNGIGANWNHCIKQANGTYIKFLFQDDVLLPNCVKAMVTILEQNNNIALVASKRDFIIEKSYLNDDMREWMEKFSDNEVNLNLKKKDGLSILDKNIFQKSFLIHHGIK
jgi:glycosyltransferase involved in cell wall biosynthesis